MIATLTGMGLSSAAGLNAYIPFLIVGLISRFTDVITLPAQYQWIESTPSLAIAGVLLGTEMVLDKIPVVDTVNDFVATAIRPTVGGLVFAASSSAEQFDNSQWMRDHPWVGAIGGAVLAGLVHVGKATSRPAIDAATIGAGTAVVSSAEDASSVGMSLVAIFAPVLVIIGLVLLIWGLWWLLRQRRKLGDRLAMPRRRRPSS